MIMRWMIRTQSILDIEGPHSASRGEKGKAIPISSTNILTITMRGQTRAVLFINKESEKFKVTDGVLDSRRGHLSPQKWKSSASSPLQLKAKIHSKPDRHPNV
jgi:hypothetical protein